MLSKLQILKFVPCYWNMAEKSKTMISSSTFDTYNISNLQLEQNICFAFNNSLRALTS